MDDRHPNVWDNTDLKDIAEYVVVNSDLGKKGHSEVEIQGILWACYNRGDYKSINGLYDVLTLPISEMLLYINEEDLAVRAIAVWRLYHGR